ncbi:MAG: DnaJ domain-containing protein, partial [Deltaproteobacteria bacterium]
MKDYYKLLEVDRHASDEQIRKSYRKLALKYHPDRNPGNPRAEEHFKEIAEAYGVLIDPAKRSEYDRWLGTGAQERRTGGGFHYSREEIFQDLFKDPRFTRVFQDLFSEFEKAGFRFDQKFFDQTFFGGRGVFFGTFFLWGPFGFRRMKIGRPQQGSKLVRFGTRQTQPFGLLKRLGKKIGNLLLGSQKELPAGRQNTTLRPQDLTYNLTIPTTEAERGTWVTISIDRGRGQEKLKVKIPPGTRSGSRLRLRGKGKRKGSGGGPRARRR